MSIEINTDSMSWWEQLEYQHKLLINKYGGIKRTAEEWQAELKDGVQILDPDGWDRSSLDRWNASWNEPITLEEFYRRRAMSTTQGF